MREKSDGDTGTKSSHRWRLTGAMLVLATTSCLATSASVAQQFEYKYDEIGRLIEVTTPDQKITYDYDAGGNLRSREVVPEPTLALMQAASLLSVGWLARRRQTRPERPARD